MVLLIVSHVRLLIFHVYLTKLHRNVYILSTVGVIFVGRLVCSVNVLYMELSYTGSLDQSTRASEHVTVTRMAGFYNCLIFWNGRTLQFKLVMPACKTMAGFINCFPLDFYVYLTKLHRGGRYSSN